MSVKLGVNLGRWWCHRASGRDEFGRRRWIQCGPVTGPHWWQPGGQEGEWAGLFFCLSTIKPQSAGAVKCGRGHCGEQFMKGIVGGSHLLPPPTQWSSRPTGGVGGA